MQTQLQILKKYLPAGTIYDALQNPASNLSILLYCFSKQFERFINTLVLIKNNFLPISQTPNQLAQIWATVFSLGENNFLPISQTPNAQDLNTRANWSAYAFYGFENIRTIEDINNCLATLELSVTAYNYTDAPIATRTSLETDNGGAYTNPNCIVVFDISNYEFTSRKSFDYEFEVDFYEGYDRPRLQLFLESLLPVTVLPLFYEG